MSLRGPLGHVRSPVCFCEILVDDASAFMPGMVVALGPYGSERPRAGSAVVEAVSLPDTVRFTQSLNAAIPAACEGDQVFEYIDDAAEEAKRLREQVASLERRVTLLEAMRLGS